MIRRKITINIDTKIGSKLWQLIQALKEDTENIILEIDYDY